ncbi:MAG: hypothetical protein IPP96_16875 [Chitinophagaceae bacterium]|nr:hypothetical protein [Chitinophagaceae bacterium]
MRSALALLLLLLTMNVKAQQPDSVRIFIDSALHVMQNNSAFSSQVNWKKMTTIVHRMSKNAKTYTEAAPAIKYAFDALGDKHGWLVFGNEDYHNPKFKPDTGRISANIKLAASKGPKVYCAVVNDDYAYVSIPFFGGQTDEQMTRFGQRIQDSLCKVITPSTKGIIIDLRLNAGGNIAPMLAGVSNVLGSGDVSITTDNKRKIVGRTTIEYNNIIMDGITRTSLTKNCADLSKLPVAVIIGPVTGSSGEAMAISFIGRDRTVLIGEETGGYTTANNGFLLAGDDYGMVLAVGYMTDRFGKAYHDNVKPALEIKGGDDFFDHVKDKKIEAAVKWLAKQG